MSIWYDSSSQSWFFRSNLVDIMLIYGSMYPCKPWVSTYGKHGSATFWKFKFIW